MSFVNRMLVTLLVGLVFTFSLLFGMQGSATRVYPPVVMECVDPSLEQFSLPWQREIGRRFDNAVGVLVHGGDFVEGQWIVGTSFTPYRHVMPVTELVKHYQQLYPGRTVVLLACNTGHLKLGIPGVYYAKSSVWCVPDREITPEMYENGLAKSKLVPSVTYRSVVAALMDGGGNRWEQDPDVVGNIFEFVSE